MSKDFLAPPGPRKRRRATHKRTLLAAEQLEQRELLDAGLASVGGLTSGVSAPFVAGLYRDLLSRAPQPAEQAAALSALDSGATPEQVALGIATSAEFRDHLITADYQNFLGRRPSATEVADWLSRMDAGMTEDQVAARFLSSAEYYSEHGANNSNWLASLYKDVLNRAPDASGLAQWQNELQQGVSRQQVAFGIVQSQEAETRVVTADYQRMLHRNPDPTGLTAWVTALENGTSNAQVLAKIAGSYEYMQAASSATQSPAPLAPSQVGTGTLSASIPVNPLTASTPNIFLTPTVLAALRQEAAANTPRWQAFKDKLDDNLNVVIVGGYQGSELQWIADYSLGYQILLNSDPVTASEYADKAIAVLRSGLQDLQKGSWTTRQFLARGDGVTTTFTLPNADLVPSSLSVSLGRVTTQAVVRGAPDTQDVVASYQTFLKVSNTPDGLPDYQQGIDWSHNSNLPNNEIDWSLPGAEPASGSTYYVTMTLGTTAAPTRTYSLVGNTFVFATAPTNSQAVFVQYVYGTHAADGSSLAYQQTSAGDGGFNSIYVDSTYTSRYLGKYVAIGLDWLDGYAGLSAQLRNQAINMLVSWSDYVRDHGYRVDDPASNYGAGGYVSRVMTALALANRSDQGPRLLNEVLAYRQDNVLPMLQNPTTSLNGGYWDEGWNYGALATQNILLAGLALESSDQITAATAERDWAGQVIRDLVSAQPSPRTVYDGGDWYAYPSPFPGKALFEVLAAASSEAADRSYANYILKHYAGQPSNDYLDLLFRNPNASASFWSALPLQDFAQGTGLLTARSSWGTSPTWVAFQMGNLLHANHQSYTPGQLQIQQGADDLLINANAPGGNQSIQRSRFGNTVVVDDNGEGAQTYRYSMGVWYGTPGVTINAYQANSNFVYLYGDYHAAYSTPQNPGAGGSVSELTRQVVYLRPDYVVVYDRVTTIKDYYTKQLRWHFLNPPVVQGNAFVETVGASKLFGQTFSTLPLTTSVSAVQVAGATVQQLITQNSTVSQSVRYVTAFQIAPSSTTSMVSTQQVLTTDGRMEGVQVGNQLVLFGRNGDVDLSTGVTYQINGSGAVTNLLTNLQAGHQYTVLANGTLLTTVTASAQGTITFAASGGQTIQVSG